MDNAEVYKLIDNLYWSTPKDLKDQAIEKLINIEESQLHLLLQPYSKGHWQDAAIVLNKIGYPKVKSIIPGLLEWIKI